MPLVSGGAETPPTPPLFVFVFFCRAKNDLSLHKERSHLPLQNFGPRPSSSHFGSRIANFCSNSTLLVRVESCLVWQSFASRLARSHATQGMAQRAVGSGLVEGSHGFGLVLSRTDAVSQPRVRGVRERLPTNVYYKKSESKVPKKDPETVPKVRVSPAEAAVMASARVARLDAALAVLEDSDEADGAEVVQLKESLKKACVQAAPANPGRRLDECQQHIARARRRLEKAPICRCRSTVFGTDIAATVGRGFGRTRSIAAGSHRHSAGTRGRHIRVGRPSSAGAAIEARARQLVVESRRTSAGRWS